MLLLAILSHYLLITDLFFCVIPLIFEGYTAAQLYASDVKFSHEHTRTRTMNELNEAKRIGIRSVEIIIDKNGIEGRRKKIIKRRKTVTHKANRWW